MNPAISLLNLLMLPYLCRCYADDGQKEMETHGSRSPHERFHDAHYKDGQHDEHMDHQAVLGSKKLAEEFDTLSPEESKKRLRVIAKKMDLNGDGFVEKMELKNWIYKSLRDLDKEETDERFDEIDDDHDGFVTWAEYVKESFGDDDFDVDVNPEKLDEADQKLLQEDKTFFAAADTNKDGKLDKIEFVAFQNPESQSHMHDSIIQNTLKEKDKNGDGFIDMEEFLGEFAERKDHEFYQVESERFSKDYDLNKDGQLDRQEMKKWLIPDLEETAKDEMEHLFTQADKNNDHKLSYDEIADEYNLFVGSEATNYGEHLENIPHEEL